VNHFTQEFLDQVSRIEDCVSGQSIDLGSLMESFTPFENVTERTNPFMIASSLRSKKIAAGP
jgi:thymidine phosphorylase